MAKLKLPPYAKVAHRKYRIEVWCHKAAQASQRYGECSSVEAVIRIDESLDAEKARDTLLHEVLHAIYAEYRLEDEDKEERTVSTIATALTQVMVDSAELRKWLGAAWAK